MAEMMTDLLGNDFPPIRRRGRRLRSAHQPEVGRVEIGADEELAADVIDIVNDAVLPRLNDLEFSRWLIRWQIAKLASALLICVEQDKSARSRQADRNAESRIVLLVDQCVAVRVAAKPMPPDLVGAQCGRLVAHKEDRIAVGSKDDIRTGIIDTLIEGFASRDRSHEDAEITTAGEINGECNPRVVGTHGPRAELVLLRMTSGERGNVEYNFFLCAEGVLPAHDGRILSALGEAALIDIAVIVCGNACIFLRLARLQFRGKRIDQGLDRLEMG